MANTEEELGAFGEKVGQTVVFSSSGPVRILGETSASFQMLMDAYIRGYRWRGENPNSDAYLEKAAYDYADKNTAPGSTLDQIANQAAHVRLGMMTRQDVSEATKILIDMVEEFVDGKNE